MRGDGGVSDDQLAAEVRAAVPSDLTVLDRPGAGRQATPTTSPRRLSFLNYLLLAFGFVAVFVGAFIIFNTYTITVAQRTREFGMLRTIGASRRQVLGAVLGEALIVGVIATILGFIGGILFAAGLTALFDAVGFGIPSTGTPIELRTVIWAVAVGLGVTVLAAMIPAVRATRVTPIQALREGHSTRKRHRPWIRPVIAALVFALSAFLLYYGVAGEGDIVTRLLLGVAGGAILFFIGVALIATYLVRPVVAFVGLLVGRLGASGKLAMENTTRNTGRTAVTAAALMIGVGLVVFVTILFSGLKESFTGAVDRSVRGDLIVSSETFGVGPADRDRAGDRGRGRRGLRIADRRPAGPPQRVVHQRPDRRRHQPALGRLPLRLGERRRRPARRARHDGRAGGEGHRREREPRARRHAAGRSRSPAPPRSSRCSGRTRTRTS